MNYPCLAISRVDSDCYLPINEDYNAYRSYGARNRSVRVYTLKEAEPIVILSENLFSYYDQGKIKKKFKYYFLPLQSLISEWTIKIDFRSEPITYVKAGPVPIRILKWKKGHIHCCPILYKDQFDLWEKKCPLTTN